MSKRWTPSRAGTRNGIYIGTPDGPIKRKCPKCEASPGRRCFRMTGGYKEFASYPIPLKNFHKERSEKRTGRKT